MREKCLLFVALIVATVFWIKGSTVQAASLTQWDLTKEYTLEKDNVRYYAYLTRDHKESWIYKAELLDKNNILDVIFPKTMEGVPVTCLGISYELYWSWPSEEGVEDSVRNIFNVHMPIECNTDVRPDPVIKNVRTVVLPDTAKELGPAAFAYMGNLSYVHLPAQLKTLNNFTFYGCRDLRKIDFPAKFKIADSDVFSYCDGLKGLKNESRKLFNDTLSFSGNMVINETEKTLIQVMPDAKKITIPARVKWIEPTAFKNSSLKTVKVAKKNKSFVAHKRCLFSKKEKELILVFGTGRTLTLSKKIKEIGQNVATTKYKIKKLIIPKKLKRVDKWKKPYTTNNEKIKIYYCGKRIR